MDDVPVSYATRVGSSPTKRDLGDRQSNGVITMKCNTFVKYEWRRRKGSGEPILKVVDILPMYPVIVNAYWNGRDNRFPSTTVPDDYVLCDGDVKVTVDVGLDDRDDDDFPVLDVTWLCQKCGNTNFPEFTSDVLKDLMSRFLEGLTFENRVDIIGEYLQQSEKQRQEMDAWREKRGRKDA